MRPRPWLTTPARSSVARKRLADSREEPASWAMSACVIVSRTSPSLAAPSALRLLDEVGEHDRDAALDGLEGLAGEALVGLAQAAPERDDELRRDVGVLAHQAPHVGAEDRDRLDASSSVSTVAERRSSSNIASSPKMSPGPKWASVIVRPSACSRIARQWPVRTT